MSEIDPDALERIRAACLAFPETCERLSHGAPTFFVQQKRPFVVYRENHHGDGRQAIWCAAQPGVQMLLLEAEPDQYFLPPYVGHLGWIGMHLNRGAAWEEIAGVIEDAYQLRAYNGTRRSRG